MVKMLLYWTAWSLAIFFDLFLVALLGYLIFAGQKSKLHYFDEYVDTETTNFPLSKKNPGAK